MAGCEEFEIAIEKRLHGALGDPERLPLEEHLVRCERCRAYEAAARRTEAGMGSEARAGLERVDWGRVERGIRGGVQSSLRMLVGAVLSAAWLAGVVWLSTPPALRSERMLRTLPAMGIVVVLVALVAGYSSRRLLALVDQGEMLVTYRQMVTANLAWARRMQWAIAALVAFFLYKALTGKAGSFDPAVYYGGLGLPLAAAWLYLRRVKVPRAEREARDLGLAAGAGPRA